MKVLAHLSFISLIIILPAFVYGQEGLVLPYNPDLNRLETSSLPNELKQGKTYRILIDQINTAHLSTESTVTQSTYISDIPDILRSIYIGIPGDMVGLNRPEASNNPIFNRVRALYENLARVQEISNTLYDATRFKPDTARAVQARTDILTALEANSMAEAYDKTQQALTLIGSAQEYYALQLDQYELGSTASIIFLDQYSAIQTFNEKLKTINFTGIFNFIIQSQQASDMIELTTLTASGDLVEVDFELFDTYINAPLLEERLSFDTYEGFSFDFSTGFFYNNLVEAEYYVESTTDARLRLVEEDKNSADIAIGALGHFTYKFLPQLRAGIALGAAISPLDGKLRYLLGPSFIWGRQNQVALTGGLALSQMDELSGAVQRDESGYFIDAGAATIPMITNLQSGFFIGITYNLTNRKQP